MYRKNYAFYLEVRIMLKTEYELLDIEVIDFEEQDVIVTSLTCGENVLEPDELPPVPACNADGNPGI